VHLHRSYLVGYIISLIIKKHVHEKAVVLILIPLVLSPRMTDKHYRHIVFLASFFGYFSLCPLLHVASLSLIKISVFFLYMGWLYKALRIEGIKVWEGVYMSGAGLIWGVGEWYMWTGDDGFLPLMLYSVYNAVGLGYGFCLFALVVFGKEKDRKEE
jgi:hypothetical protein